MLQKCTRAHAPVAQKLLRIMMHKKTNLCVAADLTTSAHLLQLANVIGPYICMLKIHVDIISDFSLDFITQLKELAQKHNFLLCEDRKFADIGTIAQAQYAGGIYKIVEWADIIIAHALSGKSCIDALAQVGVPRQRGLLLIAQLSTADNLIDAEYTYAVQSIARDYPEFIIGFIGQKHCADDSGLLQITPGISNMHAMRAHEQQYTSIKQAITENQTDIIIVGRDIYTAEHPDLVAQQYQREAWDLYMQLTY